MKLLRPAVAAAALLLLTPSPVAAPTVLSLVKAERATAVDAGADVVWVLALGSDARPGTDVLKGNADAIQLVGMNFETGSVVAIGIPRDAWVQVPGEGEGRINSGLSQGGPQLMASLVQDLVEFAPDYVVTGGMTAFATAVDAIGGVRVRSATAFTDPDHDVTIERALNELDGQEATDFARSRKAFVRGDFQRSANQQVLLGAILKQLKQLAGRGDDLAIAQGALTVAQDMDTDLSPLEMFRFARAIVTLRPAKVETCVLDGDDETIEGQAVIRVDEQQARRLGQEAREDAAFDTGC